MVFARFAIKLALVSFVWVSTLNISCLATPEADPPELLVYEVSSDLMLLGELRVRAASDHSASWVADVGSIKLKEDEYTEFSANNTKCPHHLGAIRRAELVWGIPRLRSADLASATWVDDRVLSAIASHPTLIKLILPPAPDASAEGLRRLSSLSKLESLSCFSSTLAKDQFKILLSVPLLKNLELKGVSTTGFAAVDWAKLFRTLSSLESLSFCASTAGDATVVIQSLSRSSVCTLEVCLESSISDDLLVALGGIPRLAALALSDDGRARITAKGAQGLSKILTLRSLTLEHAYLDFADSDNLVLPGLVTLRLFGQDSLTDASLEAIGKFPMLAGISLYKCARVTCAGIKHLCAAEGARTITIQHCKSLKSEEIDALKREFPRHTFVRG